MNQSFDYVPTLISDQGIFLNLSRNYNGHLLIRMEGIFCMLDSANVCHSKINGMVVYYAD